MRDCNFVKEYGEGADRMCRECQKVLEIFTFDQIFGRKEIKSALHYGDYRAGSTIEIMHQLELIEPVKGHGKGKYRIK